MSNTPRTDNLVANMANFPRILGDQQIRDFARTLELELTALRKEMAEVTAAFQKACDHEWEHVDDSFDHEYGVEVIRYMRCEKCGKHAEWDDVEHPEADDEPRLDQRELRDFP